jgi:hypothetical protein
VLELAVSGINIGYFSKAGKYSKFTYHPAQYLALSEKILTAILEKLKELNNDQQERHTGSDIRRADIREVLESEVEREEEV